MIHSFQELYLWLYDSKNSYFESIWDSDFKYHNHMHQKLSSSCESSLLKCSNIILSFYCCPTVSNIHLANKNFELRSNALSEVRNLNITNVDINEFSINKPRSQARVWDFLAWPTPLLDELRLEYARKISAPHWSWAIYDLLS